jgi:hypothetical protein
MPPPCHSDKPSRSGASLKEQNDDPAAHDHRRRHRRLRGPAHSYRLRRQAVIRSHEIARSNQKPLGPCLGAFLRFVWTALNPLFFKGYRVLSPYGPYSPIK